jgi:hypothetical protein
MIIWRQHQHNYVHFAALCMRQNVTPKEGGGDGGHFAAGRHVATVQGLQITLEL